MVRLYATGPYPMIEQTPQVIIIIIISRLPHYIIMRIDRGKAWLILGISQLTRDRYLLSTA